jgi:hypothetical protein
MRGRREPSSLTENLAQNHLAGRVFSAGPLLVVSNEALVKQLRNGLTRLKQYC